MVEISPDQLVTKITRVAQEAHRGAYKGVQKACLGRQATAMRYCTPGQSPFDDMVFPTKIARINAGKTPTGGKLSLKKAVRVDESGAEANYTGAPLDTGLLRARIYIMVEDTNNEIKGGVGCGDKGQTRATINGYALHVHQGTSKMFGRPFIEKAVMDEVKETQRTIADNTWGAITGASLL